MQRTANDARNLDLAATLGLPYAIPRNHGAISNTDAWSAQVNSFVPGSAISADWIHVRGCIQEVLDAFRAARVDLSNALPIRHWCGADCWPAIVDRITHAMNDRARRSAARVLDGVAELEGIAKPYFVHGDFGMHNLLFERKCVSAIIDFDHASVGDPAIDLAPLVGQFGSAAVGQICNRETLDRARRYRATLPLQVAAAAELAGDTMLRDHALKTFRNGTLPVLCMIPRNES